MSVEKDPWLQQALRHAPDRDVAVPEVVRDTILNAARAAVRQPEPTHTPWWQRWLAPLNHPARLGYSGAFMALLVVGLWGLDRLGQPAVAPEQAPALSAPAAAAPASPAPASPTSANATSASPAAPQAEPGQVAAVADKAALKESAESRQMAVAAKAKVAAQAERQRREDAPPAAAAPTQAAAPVLAPQEPAANMVAAAKPVPAAAAAPAPAPVAAPAAVSATAAAPSPAAQDAPLAAARLDATLAGALPRKAAPSPAARSKATANIAEPASPLAAMLGALRTADGARWQTEQAQGVHGLVQDQWLVRLQQLAGAGPWQPVAVLPEGPPTVQWPGRDGGQLWLQPTGQVWLAWHGQVHGARLPQADATALRAQLAEWH